MTASTHWGSLDSALELLTRAAEGLSAEDLGRRTPCSSWNVMQVLQHAAGDQLGYSAMISGLDGPAFDPFAPSGDLETDVHGLITQAVDSARTAWRSVAPDAAPIEIPIPMGPVDVEVAAAACALDAAVHAWDVAVATGRPSPLTDELSAELLGRAPIFVEPVRAFAFQPAIPDVVGASATESLLRFLGRNPAWMP